MENQDDEIEAQTFWQHVAKRVTDALGEILARLDGLESRLDRIEEWQSIINADMDHLEKHCGMDRPHTVPRS